MGRSGFRGSRHDPGMDGIMIATASSPEAARVQTPMPAGRSRHSYLSLFERLSLIAATALYALSIYSACGGYLTLNWDYLGFTFRAPGLAEVALMALLLGTVATVLPVRVVRPSGLVLMFLFVVVYVPGIVVTFCLDADRIDRYLPFTVSMGIVFTIASLVSDFGCGPRQKVMSYPSRAFCIAILICWMVLCAVLVLAYREVMNFVALDDVYVQRAAGASSGLLMGYLQTYFSNVLSPALIGLGLVYRRRVLLIAGIAGCLVMYAINAQKTIILLPVAMIALHLQLSSPLTALRGVWVPVAVFASVTFFAVSQWEENVVAGVLAIFFVHRTIAVPGLTLSQYFDQFSAEGFTFWSHVKGFDLLVPTPPAYAFDPLWPGLGYILGDRMYGYPEFNLNANLFSGDGIAAAGAAGVLVVGLAFVAFLWALDRATVRWDYRFVLLALLPVALALTNGHFFTTLLSFGGLFWLVLFALMTGSSRPVGSAYQPQLARRLANRPPP
jgi:hypothetical protein